MERKKERAYITKDAVFASRLSEIMGDRGLNQTTLQAKILEQSGKTLQRQTISLYMNGQSKPDTERLTLLCNALDVSADYLLGLSQIESNDLMIQEVCEFTGLSERAITNIDRLSGVTGSLSSLLENELFLSSFFDLHDMDIVASDVINPIEDGTECVNEAQLKTLRLLKFELKEKLSRVIDDLYPTDYPIHREG